MSEKCRKNESEGRRRKFFKKKVKMEVKAAFTPECEESADEGLEPAGEKVGKVTVGQVHTNSHPDYYCLGGQIL